MTVAGAVIERDDSLLLVKNQRRGGACDWSTPGGVVDPTDDSIVAGLGREVEEETGLHVGEWEGPLYAVRAVASDMGWQLECEVHRALQYDGDLRVDDPDGIVIDAAFVATDAMDGHLADCFRWVRDPLAAWIAGRWTVAEFRTFHYEIRGTSLADFEVVSASVG
jgi:8-oxo-dGTP diphosphatase